MTECPASNQLARWLAATLATLFVVRFGGLDTAFLPGAGVLLALAIVASAAVAFSGPEAAQRRRRANEWVRAHRFQLALVALAVMFVGLQVSRLHADLGRSPLDIDQHRLANTVRQFFLTGEIPHETVEDYPGVFYWVMVGAYLAVFLPALMTGAAADFAELTMPWLVLVGRVCCTLLYAAAIPITGLIGRRLSDCSGAAVGLLAAVLMTLSPLGARVSSEFRNEAALLLLVTAAILAAVCALRSGAPRYAILAGTLAGLATGVKYTGVFALLAVVVAVLASGADRKARVAAGALASFVVALGISNPFLWLDFPNFVAQLATEVRMTGVEHWAATDQPAWFYTTTLTGSFGLPLILLAAAGVVGAFVWRPPQLAVLLAFALPYQLFMSGQASQFTRWVYPLLPIAALLAALTLVRLGRWLREGDRLPAALGPPLRVARMAAALCVLPAVLAAAESVVRSWTPSTYELAEAWLMDNISDRDWMLTEHEWLARHSWTGRVDRVPNLVEAMQDPTLRKDFYDWILVPETRGAAAPFEGFELAQSFVARPGLFGNFGFDLHVYQAEEAPDQLRTLTIDFSGPRSARFLGRGWGQPEPAGRNLGGHAGLFLPLWPGSGYGIELDMLIDEGADTQTALAWNRADSPGLEIDCGWVALEAGSDGKRSYGCRLEVPAELVRDRVDVLTLEPVSSRVWLRELRARPLD
jgi:hypothetical protein